MQLTSVSVFMCSVELYSEMKWFIVQMSCHIKELTNERLKLVDCVEVTFISFLKHCTLHIITDCKSNCINV